MKIEQSLLKWHNNTKINDIIGLYPILLFTKRTDTEMRRSSFLVY